MINADTTLSLDDLSREVSRMLDRLGLADGPEDGRVSALADPRTVRYYQTLGLVDRPKIVGRDARYGRRHVLQIVAVKALQASGLNLASIQERLYGRSEKELEALLSSAAAERPRRPEVKPIALREVAVAPGLRLVVEESFAPGDLQPLLDRIRAALESLGAAHGGKKS